MDNIGIGIGILVFNDKNQLLLILRNSDPVKASSKMRLEGTYTLPSGNVKYGELFEEAGKRKLKEETNLDVNEKDLKVVSLAVDINDYAHYITIGMIAIKYYGELILKNSGEFVSYDWFDINNLPDNLCFPSKKIIYNYLNNKIYNDKER